MSNIGLELENIESIEVTYYTDSKFWMNVRC